MKITMAQISFDKHRPDKKFFFSFTGLTFILLSAIFTYSQSNTQSILYNPPFDEEELKSNFDDFIARIEPLNLTKKYPEITRKILSHDARQQETAMKMLAASEDIDAIPWILLLLDSDERGIQTWAGNALEDIVSTLALKRRDIKFGSFVVLKPLGKQDVDLKPLAWIILKMLRTDNPNLIAYAITMSRYLNLYEFEGVISNHKNSPHPAVTNTMKWAIEELKLQKKYEKNELEESK